MTQLSARPLPWSAGNEPAGVSYLPAAGIGIDLGPQGYTESEWAVSGSAREWTHVGDGEEPAGEGASFTTRVQARLPPDGRWNGSVLVEPLHPNLESGVVWKSAHPWIMRTGTAWVGITQDRRSAGSLAEVDPDRYDFIDIPAAGMRFDIVGGILAGIRRGDIELGLPRPPERIMMSGWSMTGSFCRVFLGSGFHRRWSRTVGEPIVDGYLIAISSGGAGRSGYPPINDRADHLPLNDPRRTIGAHGVPVFEVMSELESETHFNHVRPDSDESADRYRLYQVAGTSHNSGPRHLLTNAHQYTAAGIDIGARAINETPGDGRLDFIGRALYQALHDWIADGTTPPHAETFTPATGPMPDELIPPGAVPLRRDESGNAVGGIRTPWVEAPLARYLPHSTPAPGGCRPSRFAPAADEQAIGRMIGHMTPLPEADVLARFPDQQAYLKAYTEAADTLIAQRFLLPPERDELIEAAAGSAFPASAEPDSRLEHKETP